MKNMQRLLCAITFSLLIQAQAEIIFFETFDNPEADAPLSDIGWYGNKTTLGTAYDGTAFGTGLILSSTDCLFTRVDAALDGEPLLGWTDKSTFGTIDEIYSVGFSLKNKNIAEDVKVAFKVDGSWYVSQEVFNNTESEVSSTIKIPLQSLSWNSLDFISGSSLVEGGPAILPSTGDLQAVGVFNASATAGVSSFRVDNYTLETFGDFLETFDNSGGDTNLSSIGWYGNKTVAGTAYDGKAFGDGLILSSQDYLFTRVAPALDGEPLLGWTDKATFGAINKVDSVGFSLRNKNIAEDVKVAFKVDGNWYVSREVFNSAVTEVQITTNIPLASLTWNSLDFVSGSSLVEGGPASLPLSGNVQAVGIFDASTTTANSLRVDNYTVTFVSESGYDSWSSGYGLVEGPDGDDDADGLSNLYEFGLGGNPTNSADQGTSPSFGLVNGGFSYIYPQLSDLDSGLTYFLETCTDLVGGTWTNFGYTVAGTNVTGGTLDFVTNTTDTVEDQKFIRLIIE
jgi:hypothetical protein